ncbi:MAG: NusG domain II-containing protein [Bacteroidia bacterium]|nr:NusG domain II-containing protein [Bacteroidia bacterium]
MISRRSFLKLSGLTAVAIGAGAGTGSLFRDASARRFAMHGFVPDSDQLTADVLRAFLAELPEDARALTPVIHADARWTGVIRSAMRGASHSSGPLFGGGNIVLRMQPLTDPVPADVLVLDDRKRMYAPERDFTSNLSTVRDKLHGSAARWQISAEYTESAPLAGLLSGGQVLVIENEQGLVDKITMNRHRTLTVRGPQGATGVTISEHGAHVHSSTCRHALCRRGSASRSGDVIACAPNRILLRVEKA